MKISIKKLFILLTLLNILLFTFVGYSITAGKSSPTGMVMGFTLVAVSLFITYNCLMIFRENTRIRSFLYHLPTSVVITDLRGKIEFVNRYFEDLTGYSFGEVIGKNPRIVQSGRTEDKTYRHLWETIRKGETWTGSLWNKKRDDSLFYEKISIAPVFTNSKMTHFIASKLDFTDHYKETERAKETSYVMKTIMENVPIGIVLVNSEKEIFQINKTASRILGYKSHSEAEKELIGRNCCEKLCVKDQLCPLEVEGMIISDVKLSIDINGEQLSILKTVIPLQLHGKPIHIEAFLDISETIRHEVELEKETKRANYMAQKSMEAEERLKKHTENLEQMVMERTEELEKTIVNLREAQSQLVQSEKLISIGQLAAGIAHEINTPIQYVGDNIRFFKEAFSEILLISEKYKQIPEIINKESLEKIAGDIEEVVEQADLNYFKDEIPGAIEQSMEGVNRVAAIVRSMKDFSHPGVHEKTNVDINKAIESTITVSRNEWKYVAELNTDLDRSLPLVPCLPGELNQVFLNIIINASQAIADVVGDSGEKGTIDIKTKKTGNFVEVRMSDTGGGIPKSIQHKIFDPFFTTKEVGKGTGQGLSISYPVIVEKHNGELLFESQEGVGTTFIVKLPLGI